MTQQPKTRLELVNALRSFVLPHKYQALTLKSTAMLRAALAYYSAPEHERHDSWETELAHLHG